MAASFVINSTIRWKKGCSFSSCLEFHFASEIFNKSLFKKQFEITLYRVMGQVSFVHQICLRCAFLCWLQDQGNDLFSAPFCHDMITGWQMIKGTWMSILEYCIGSSNQITYKHTPITIKIDNAKSTEGWNHKRHSECLQRRLYNIKNNVSYVHISRSG